MPDFFVNFLIHLNCPTPNPPGVWVETVYVTIRLTFQPFNQKAPSNIFTLIGVWVETVYVTIRLTFQPFNQKAPSNIFTLIFQRI